MQTRTLAANCEWKKGEKPVGSPVGGHHLSQAGSWPWLSWPGCPPTLCPPWHPVSTCLSNTFIPPTVSRPGKGPDCAVAILGTPACAPSRPTLSLTPRRHLLLVTPQGRPIISFSRVTFGGEGLRGKVSRRRWQNWAQVAVTWRKCVWQAQRRTFGL